MENAKKLDLISLVLSAVIHLIFLTVFSATENLFQKTYQVVNVLPLSFDTEVESDLVGEKSVKGNTRGEKNAEGNSLTFGSISKAFQDFQGGKSAKLKRKGISESNFVSQQLGSTPSEAKLGTSGNGYGYLKLSIEFPRKGKGRPSIKSSRLVPYLLKVKNEIMKNWKIPYYRGENGKRKAVIVLTIENDGTVKELTIKELSTDNIFNRSAISAVYAVKKFEPFPKGLNLRTVKVKVKFEIE